MKKSVSLFIGILLVLAVLSCRTLQGIADPPSTESPELFPPTITPVVEGGEDAPDVTDTTWTLTYFDEAVQQEYTYDITFLPGGRLSNTHPNDSTPDNDRWEQAGNVITIFYNNEYAIYTGTIDGDSMSGTATNVTGSTWDWSAVRKEAGDAGATTEPSGELDVTGTTWSMSYHDNAVGQDYTYDITFLPGGKLSNEHPNDSTPDNDRWEQIGTTIILYFNDAYATYTGIIDGDTITGTATNVKGSTWEWSAVRKE